MFYAQFPNLPSPAPASPVPMSGEWASPTSWAQLFQTAGVPAAILIFVFMLFGVFSFLFLWWTVGPKGLVRALGIRFVARLNRFLGQLEKNLGATQTTLADHMRICTSLHQPGGPSYVSELRQAAPLAVAGLREMATAMEIPEAVAHFSDAADQLHAPPPVAAQ